MSIIVHNDLYYLYFANNSVILNITVLNFAQHCMATFGHNPRSWKICHYVITHSMWDRQAICFACTLHLWPQVVHHFFFLFKIQISFWNPVVLINSKYWFIIRGLKISGWYLFFMKLCTGSSCSSLLWNIQENLVLLLQSSLSTETYGSYTCCGSLMQLVLHERHLGWHYSGDPSATPGTWLPHVLVHTWLYLWIWREKQ